MTNRYFFQLLFLGSVVVLLAACQRNRFEYAQVPEPKEKPEYNFQIDPQKPVRGSVLPVPAQ